MLLAILSWVGRYHLINYPETSLVGIGHVWKRWSRIENGRVSIFDNRLRHSLSSTPGLRGHLVGVRDRHLSDHPWG